MDVLGQRCQLYRCVNLKNWDVFKSLDSKYLGHIVLAQAFGEDCDSGIFITSNDTFYVVGSNVDGQIGLNKDINHSLHPIILEELGRKKIIGLGCGGWHVLALSAVGKVYSLGDNSWGQLGRSSGERVDQVCLGRDFATQVSCGLRHSLILTSSAKVYSFGCNSQGQCGVAVERDSVMQPTLVPLPEPVISIACGGYYSAVLASSGKVYAWGCRHCEELDLCNLNHEVTEVATGAVQIVTSGPNLYYLSKLSSVYYLPPDQSSKVFVLSGIKRMAASFLKNFVAGEKIKDIKTIMWTRQGSGFEIEEMESSILESFAPFPMPDLTRSDHCLNSVKISQKFNLIGLYNNKELSDLTIKVGSEEFYVHKLVLQRMCPYFRVMLSPRWFESQSREIEIKVYTPKIYSQFLRYIYTGYLDELSAFELLELWDLAKCYLQEDLQAECIGAFQVQLNEENAAELLYQIVNLFNFEEPALLNPCILRLLKKRR